MTGTTSDSPEVFEDYFRFLDDKIAFLDVLYQDNRKEEALTLCCVYIEGLAQRIYSSGPKRSSSKQVFVKVLLEYGGEALLCLVDPVTLAESMRGVRDCGEPCVSLGEKIKAHYCASPTELRSIDELVANARSRFSTEELALLEKHAWLGTIAALTYKKFRSPLVHELHAVGGIRLSDTVYRGAPVDRISFTTLYPALKRISDHWKHIFSKRISQLSEVDA